MRMWEIPPRAVVMALCLQFVTVLGPSAFAAEDTPSGSVSGGKDLGQALRGGGYVVYFRHAATDAEQVDADHPDFKRCATQRNLSPDGRRMAYDIGRSFKILGIRVGKVVTSPFCRTVETAELAFGRHQVSNDLYFAVGVDKDERTRQSAELRRMLATPPPPGTNSVLVAHNANLKEATGTWPKREGDAHVFRPRPGGGFDYIGEVTAAEWLRWARAR